MKKSQSEPCLTGVYIDGFNLYHAVAAHRDQTVKWLSHMMLARSFCDPRDKLSSVVFFTAVLTWEHKKQQRHRNFIAAQKAVGVEVVESNFRRKGRKGGHEEKQTDVEIALRMYRDATERGFKKQVLITADSDQVPTVRCIKEVSPDTHIILAAPPGREHVARELGAVAHERRPLTFGRLLTCRLPRSVLGPDGKAVATMPSCYNSN